MKVDIEKHRLWCLTVNKLKTLCKEKKLRGYSRLTKSSLIDLILHNDQVISNGNIDFSYLTVRELKALCKERGLKCYSNLRKDELVKLLEPAKTDDIAEITEEQKVYDDDTCQICIEGKSEKECLVCSHKICPTCYRRVLKCPFCRTVYPERIQARRLEISDPHMRTSSSGYTSSLTYRLVTQINAGISVRLIDSIANQFGIIFENFNQNS